MYPNVKYELQEFETLIGSVAEPILTDTNTQGYPRRTVLNDNIKREVERIKQTFIHEIFSFADERHLERYIQYHQQSLIRIMDGVAGLLNTRRRNEKELYHACYKGLDELLSFVERHFTKYFDQDTKAPEAYISITRNDIQSNLKTIQDGLLGKSVDPRLADIMLFALRKIIDNEPVRDISYRKVLYAKELQKELSTLVANKDQNGGSNEALRSLMYYLNYNSVKSFAYHTHYIDVLLSETETRGEMIEKLSYILKTINQAQVKPGISYNVNAPSLRSQLNSYIIEEMEHLQRVHQLTNLSGSRSLDALFSSLKIQLEMSVAQAAYMIKVFIEAKLILNQNITELLRFLSRFLTTKRSESISYDSLRTKYYNVELSTRESVRNILLKMITLIDKHDN